MSRVKPILFSTDDVRATLNGRKTVIRKLIKVPSYYPHFYELHDNIDGAITGTKNELFAGFYKDEQVFYIDGEKHINAVYYKAPCKPGDILYVRETWGTYNRYWWEADYFMYRADYPDGTVTYEFDGHTCDLPKWHPSICMPKEAARIWLKVKDVRVERLQDIGWDDICDEGIIPDSYVRDNFSLEMLRGKFSVLWDSTIKKKDLLLYGWDANRWVWRIAFERCEKPEEV